MRKISMIIIVTLALSPACLPVIHQTTWSTSQDGGQVTLSTASDTARKWAAQCNAQRRSMEWAALGATVLASASGMAAGVSQTLEAPEYREATFISAIVSAALSSYLGLRTWYGARLYGELCTAYDGSVVSVDTTTGASVPR